MASSIRTPSVSQIVIPRESAGPSGSVTGRESGAPHRDAVLANVAHPDVASGDAALVDPALGDREASIALVHADSPEPAPKKRTVLYASAGVAAAAIALAGLLMLRPHAGGGSDPVPTKMSAAQRTTAAGAPVVTASATVSTATGAAAMVVATRADSLRSASATPAPTAPVVQPEKRAPESAPPELRVPRAEVHPGPINIPISAAPSVDSIVRSAPERPRVSDTDRTATVDRVAPPTSVDVDDTPPTPAKLIGRVPEPRFPDALLRSGKREGQVVVRFMVNELGSVDVASMIVERSDDELFTAAVRDILPRFRFEPARTHGSQSKPVATWVSVPFRFTTKR